METIQGTLHQGRAKMGIIGIIIVVIIVLFLLGHL
jgi:hypothetical protein